MVGKVISSGAISWVVLVGSKADGVYRGAPTRSSLLQSLGILQSFMADRLKTGDFFSNFESLFL